MRNVLFENLREKAVKENIPLGVHFDLTHRCNLKCIHCYAVAKNALELITSEIKNILDQLAEAGTLYLAFSGGEILTREDFFEIAFYARKLNFALRLLTNGTLINEEIADKITSLCPELVAISIYSTDSHIHDAITNRADSFQRTISTIKMLKERKVRLKISNVIMRKNVKDYNLVYNLAQEFGVEFQTDYKITVRNNGNKYPLRFHIGDEDLYSVLSSPVFFEKNEPDPHEINTEIFDIIPCGASHISCYISPYGNVYPCIQLGINCDTLRAKNFKEIWKNSEQMLNIRSMTISDLPRCSKCNLFQYCRLCIGLNYTDEGSCKSPSRRICKEAKIMRELGKKRR